MPTVHMGWSVKKKKKEKERTENYKNYEKFQGAARNVEQLSKYSWAIKPLVDGTHGARGNLAATPVFVLLTVLRS